MIKRVRIGGVSLIYIEKKDMFLFDSFGFEGFEELILKDDQEVLKKILYGIEKFNKRDNKTTLITLKFSIQQYEKIKSMNRLNETTFDLLHLMNEYRKKIVIIVHLVDNHLEIIERDT